MAGVTTGDAELREAAVRDPLLADLRRRWEAARGASSFPRSADLDPVDLAAMAGDLLRVEMEAPHPHFRVSWIGTSMVMWFRRDITGMRLDELAPHPHFRLFLDALNRAVSRQAPVELAARVNGENRTGESRVMEFEALLLPLAGDGETIDGLLVACRQQRAAQAQGAPAALSA
ncbi:MAG TPA: PAS domain-containing protein [Azospirillaceae bacterium]|nr:PAS domain-containing protein [Azospirillaceae bacterium]